MTVATVGLAAAPARLCRFLLRVAFGERSGPALSRTAGLGEQPLQLCDAGITLGKAVVQLPQLSGVGLEKPAKLNDLSDQLLVGAGFSARRSDARRNSQRYACRLRSWWMPLNKYLQLYPLAMGTDRASKGKLRLVLSYMALCYFASRPSWLGRPYG